MPPGEIVVTCPGCGSQSRLPYAALKRDSSYCSRCGKAIPLNNVQTQPSGTTDGPAKPKRRPYRPTKRR